MRMNGVTDEAFLTLLQQSLNKNYTDEQKDLIKHFGEGPTFCFADPGTGKTFTAIGGLLYAELFKSIPGNNIYAMSFTNMATGELAVRHKVACESLGITSTVHFSTLHKLCTEIIAKHYRLLGMSSFGSVQSLSFSATYKMIEDACNEWNFILQPNQIRAVIRACNTLNSALVFDEDNVKSKMCFKECNVTYEVFDKIRGLLFTYAIYTDSVNVSDIMLYTLMLMQKFPEVSQEFKAQCKLMLIDEAQDLSLLHLRIISMLTDNPIFIGDMKQQIYAFNGACQEIVQAFFKAWPEAKTTKLTQSFRCKNEIADYATHIILHNNVGGEDFTGNGPGGLVQLHHSDKVDKDSYDLNAICTDIRTDFITNNNRLTRDYLFLFRNNISAIPIAEELFKKGVPFRVNKYTPAYDVPVIKEMCELLQLCESPRSLDYISALRYLIPEFRRYSDIKKHPYYQLMRKTGSDVFSINYPFKDHSVGSDAMNLLMRVRDMLLRGEPVSVLFNTLWPLYNEMWVKPNEWKLEATPDYYVNTVYELTSKPFAQFINDEVRKQSIIKESIRYERGVRCYTMHASKGLEADVVYIVDAEDTLIPNKRKLEKMVRRKCEMDAARTIREERSLCYVACTRAKEELHIVYSTKPSSIILGSNEFKEMDDIYRYYSTPGDDIKAFERFVGEHVQL